MLGLPRNWRRRLSAAIHVGRSGGSRFASQAIQERPVKPYYERDGIVIYHGDCLEILGSLSGVTCILADPPYSSGTRQAANRSASNIPKRGERWAPERAGIVWDSSFSSFGLWLFLGEVLRLSKATMVAGAHAYWFCDWRHYPLFALALEQSGLFVNNLLVWDKGVYALGGNYRSQHEFLVYASKGPAQRLTRADRGNVIPGKRVSGGKHPTEKPVGVLRWVLECVPNGLVLDPFMGSGSALLAARALGRTAVGVELEERYCELAARRLEQEVLAVGA